MKNNMSSKGGKLKTIKQIKNLKNKTVLVRVDYNVAINKGNVAETERIERSYQTLNFLIKNKAKIILISHLGRPGGKKVKKYSLFPLVKYLNKMSARGGSASGGKKVLFADDCLGEKVSKQVAQLKAGQILLLENLRFYNAEKYNDTKFAQELASLADIYVNDAFAVCHRSHASVVAITKFLPAYAGFNLINEITSLNKALKGFKRPSIAIIGGLKISTKIKVIEQFLKRYDYVLIGGALANNFWISQKINIGQSVYEKEHVKLAAQLYEKYKNKIILPIDVKIAKKISSKAKAESMRIFELCKLKNKNWQIVDIGPKTEIYFESFINNAKTIIYNGAMGIFEIDNFSHGTYYLTQKIAIAAKGPAYGVVGGGETIVALDTMGCKSWPDFVSTGGGAMLEFLEGKILPGIKPLMKK
jgi:phosphoglycerate kinase